MAHTQAVQPLHPFKMVILIRGLANTALLVSTRCSLKRNVCLCPIAMTTAAIPVEELLQPPPKIVNYIALHYAYNSVA